MILLRFLILFYVLGVIALIIKRISKKTENVDGLLAVFLFPLMILTEKGRKNLMKGKNK